MKSKESSSPMETWSVEVLVQTMLLTAVTRVTMQLAIEEGMPREREVAFEYNSNMHEGGLMF